MRKSCGKLYSKSCGKIIVKRGKLRKFLAESGRASCVCETIKAMSKNGSHKARNVISFMAVLIIIAAVVSAFVWPGWAVKSSGSSAGSSNASPAVPSQSSSASSSGSSVSASPLPSDASTLMKVMPEKVGSYVRGEIVTVKDWDETLPIEQYKITYSSGLVEKDIAVNVGQWADASYAMKQYSALTGNMRGKELGRGNVKVNGENKGTYLMTVDQADESKAIVVWQNDTVVFRAYGLKEVVGDFYMNFPL